MPSTPPAQPPVVPASTWADTVAQLPRTDLSSLAPAGSRLLVVSAHPDDETIGAGRLAAGWAEEIGPVDAIVLTAGEACFGDTGAAAQAVGEERLREWDTAVTALGAVPHGCAHLPDHALGRHEDVVEEILDALAPAVDAVAVTWCGDPHPDHAAAGRVAARVAERAGLLLLPYLVWTTFRRSPDEVGEPLTCIGTRATAGAARDRALACYRTQLDMRADRPPVVPPDMLAHHDRQLVVGRPR